MSTPTPPSDPYDTPRPSEGGEGLPSFPPAPAPFPAGGEIGPRPEPPSSILAAVKLMYVGAGLSVLSTLFGLTGRAGLRDKIATDQPEFSPSQVDTAVNVTTGGLVVVGLLAVGLWIWMAQTNKRGLGWARIVATVLGGLNIVFTLFSLSQAAGLGIVLNFVSIALAGAILWLLYRPDSSAHYAAVFNQPGY